MDKGILSEENQHGGNLGINYTSLHGHSIMPIDRDFAKNEKKRKRKHLIAQPEQSGQSCLNITTRLLRRAVDGTGTRRAGGLPASECQAFCAG